MVNKYGKEVTETTADTRAKKGDSTSAEVIKEEKLPPYVIACATMWHESSQEMFKLLTSIFRYDLCLPILNLQFTNKLHERTDVALGKSIKV